LFIWLCWQVQLRIAAHLAKVSSSVLTQSLIKMRRILVISVIAAVAVPGFLAYNVYDHASTGGVVQTVPNSSVYTFNYSVWFKLLWASFLLWLSRPSNADASSNTATDLDVSTKANPGGSRSGERTDAVRLGATTNPDPANPDQSGSAPA